MSQKLPEELEAMAWLYGQSKEIDSMMTDTNAQLVTNSNTIRNQIDAYRNQQRQQPRPPVGYQTENVSNYIPTPEATHIPLSPIQAPMPQYIPHYDYHQFPTPIVPDNKPVLPQSDPNQLEFNLQPDKADIIINLLREINVKLGKLTKNDDKTKTEKKSLPKVP